MYSELLEEISKLAHEIDCRINLFQGYSPKKTVTYKGELLFWRQVVNIYGLFADSDRSQLKDKQNLIKLMMQYNLIERDDYRFAKKFWITVSEFRKWLCHNNDKSLYYVKDMEKKIQTYLVYSFSISSNKPKYINDLKQDDWQILAFNIDAEFQRYLQIVKKGLTILKESADKGEVIEAWISLFAKSLFANKELIHNVLADIAEYEKINQNLKLTVPTLEKTYYQQLEEGGFSAEDIEKEIKSKNIMRTNKEILTDSIRNSCLI